MDNNYFLVKVTKGQKIELYFINKYNNILKYNYPVCFTNKSIHNIFQLLNLHNLVKYVSIIHALYLGKELYKAEITIFTNQRYIQE